ncbi:MAG: hypothetical protein HZA67_03280 [Rhodospirillales bacterium]|nr:hypothetical protein [Rhodospirillales bacterium]
MSGLFDLIDALAFFKSTQRRYESYRQGHIKSTEDLLYIILGLNHLREWIAPDYNKTKSKWPPADTAEKTFSKAVFENHDFGILRSLANGTKHAKAVETGYAGGAPMDDWGDFDSVANVDKGPPTAHFVDERPIEELVAPVIQLYENWFSGRYHP